MSFPRVRLPTTTGNRAVDSLVANFPAAAQTRETGCQQVTHTLGSCRHDCRIVLCGALARRHRSIHGLLAFIHTFCLAVGPKLCLRCTHRAGPCKLAFHAYLDTNRASSLISCAIWETTATQIPTHLSHPKVHGPSNLVAGTITRIFEWLADRCLRFSFVHRTAFADGFLDDWNSRRSRRR